MRSNARLDSGEDIQAGDVEGAIRQAIASDAQMILPTLEKNGKLAMAAISTAKKTIHARTPTQDAYIRAMDRAEMVFGTEPGRHRENLSCCGLCRLVCWNGAPLTGSS